MSVVETYFKYIQFEKRYSVYTLQSYSTDISQFANFLATQYEEQDITKVTHSMIRSWVVSLMEQQEKASTINRKISTLKSLYKYLLKKEVIALNPTNKIIRPKLPKRLPTFVDEKAMEKLFDTFCSCYIDNRDLFLSMRKLQ